MIGTCAMSYLRKKWVVAAPAEAAAVEHFARQLKMPGIVAQLLINRGIPDITAAISFLDPRFRDLFPPEMLPNMDAAASRIAAAVAKHEKITLYGDYDVDGITGTAMLWHTLKAANANVDYDLAHRLDQVYGVHS